MPDSGFVSQRFKVYYLASLAWFGAATGLNVVSRDGFSPNPVTGRMFLAGWVLLATITAIEYFSFMSFLASRHPALHRTYVGTFWFINASHWRLLALATSDEGNTDPQLVAHKRAYLAMFLIPFAALGAFLLSMLWRS